MNINVTVDVNIKMKYIIAINLQRTNKICVLCYYDILSLTIQSYFSDAAQH